MYCNYSKDKFGNELTFIIPSWMSLEEGNVTTDSFGCPIMRFKGNEKAYFLLSSLGASERAYTRLLNAGCAPQEARQILPNALKTEINMCGFTSDWKYFFSLRSSHAGAKGAHPDMSYITDMVYDEFIKNNLL